MQDIEIPDYRKKPQNSLHKILDTNVKLVNVLYFIIYSSLAVQTTNLISHVFQNKSKSSQYTIPDIPNNI